MVVATLQPRPVALGTLPRAALLRPARQGGARRCVAPCRAQQSDEEQQPQQQQQPPPVATEEPPAAEADAAAAEAEADKNLQLPVDVIQRLRTTVFSFDTFFVTSVENYQAGAAEQQLPVWGAIVGPRRTL